MEKSYEYLMVGAIAGTHGLRGEVKVLSKTDFPEKRFRKGSQLFVREVDKLPFREVTVQSARQHKQFWLVVFQELPSIQDVEGWKGMQLCVRATDAVELPEGTYYIHQLIGLNVVTDDGRTVGRLVEVLTPSANDVYVVRGTLQPRDVLIPAIPPCILNVNLDEGVMTVHLMPGLLDKDDAE